jgi:hypothetical protein
MMLRQGGILLGHRVGRVRVLTSKHYTRWIGVVLVVDLNISSSKSFKCTFQIITADDVCQPTVTHNKSQLT